MARRVVHEHEQLAEAAAHVLKHPRAKLDEILKIMPGPDFPGGGQIISPAAEIREAYETGRGSLVVRAKYEKEQLARGQWRIVVTELPHGVSCRQVMEEIEKLVNPKADKRQRQFILDQVEAVRDESDRKSKLRLVIEPRSSRQDADELMATLMVNTALETRIPVNLTWLGLDGLPETKGILEILKEWGDFRVNTVRRRTQLRLDRVQERLHLVLGRLMAYVKIDEIIKLIRASEDQAEARLQLQKRFRFTEKQTEDIVNLRLGQLTKLDGVALNDERKKLEAERKVLKEILGDEKELKKLVISELQDDARKYGDGIAAHYEAGGLVIFPKAPFDDRGALRRQSQNTGRNEQRNCRKREERQEQRPEPPGARVDRELRRGAGRGPAGRGQQGVHRVGQRGLVVGREVPHPAAQRLAVRRDVGGHDGHPARPRFDRRQAEPLEPARRHHQVRRAVGIEDLLVGGPLPRQRERNAERPGQRPEPRRVGTFADQPHRRARPGPRRRAEDGRLILVGDEPRDREDDRRPVPRTWPGVAPVRYSLAAEPVAVITER